MLMMRERILLKIVRCILFSTVASAATSPNDADHQIVQPSSPNPSPSNVSLVNSLRDEYDIMCNAGMGSNFNLSDCINSLTAFELGRQPVTFSQRPPSEGEIPLPFRWMGRKWFWLVDVVKKKHGK